MDAAEPNEQGREACAGKSVCFFYGPSVSEGTRHAIWRWWEQRRYRYNRDLFLVGLVAWFLVLIAGSAAVKPGVDFEEPFMMFFWSSTLCGPCQYCLHRRADLRHSSLSGQPAQEGVQGGVYLFAGVNRSARYVGSRGLALDGRHRGKAGLGLGTSPGDSVAVCAFPDAEPNAASCFTVSNVSASAAVLSVRYRFTRANRSAKPLA